MQRTMGMERLPWAGNRATGKGTCMSHSGRRSPMCQAEPVLNGVHK